MSTEATITATDIRAQAREAWERQQSAIAAADEENQRRNDERAAAALKRLLAKIGVEAEPTSGRITLDGVEFVRGEFDYRDALYVAVACQVCGGQVLEYVKTLADVGQGLQPDAKPHHHYCPGKPRTGPAPPPEHTPAERLEALIREIARGEMDA